jgi:transcriptional regulator with XRE-family HTH domain
MKDEMNECNSLQERLTLLMEMRGINKSALARMADVKPQAVTKWFDRGDIGKESALKIAGRAGVSVDWLLHGGAELHELSGHRKARLSGWLADNPADEDFTQILNGEIPFTDKTARRIELDLNMPAGYLDAEMAQSQQVSMSVEDKELLYHFHKLPQHVRDEIMELTKEKSAFYDRMFDELSKLRGLK